MKKIFKLFLFYFSFFILCLVLFFPYLFRMNHKKLLTLFTKYVLFLFENVLGIKSKINGEIPNFVCIVASNHESSWETCALWYYFNNPSFFLKKELLNIPILSNVLKTNNSVVIDRENTNILSIISNTKKNIKKGYKNFVIFPEGTRYKKKANYQKGKYQPGVYYIAKFLKIPVIPVGLNSGKFFPPGGIEINSGTISINIGDPIDTELNEKDFMVKLKSEIEKLSNG